MTTPTDSPKFDHEDFIEWKHDNSEALRDIELHRLIIIYTNTRNPLLKEIKSLEESKRKDILSNIDLYRKNVLMELELTKLKGKLMTRFFNWIAKLFECSPIHCWTKWSEGSLAQFESGGIVNTKFTQMIQSRSCVTCNLKVWRKI